MTDVIFPVVVLPLRRPRSAAQGGHRIAHRTSSISRANKRVLRRTQLPCRRADQVPSEARSSLARQVQVVSGVHHDLLAHVDEHGHLDDSPSLQGGRL